MTAALADLLSLPTQHVWQPLPSHWRNVDVTDLDLLRAHPDLGFLDELETFVEQLKDADDTQRRVMQWLVHFSLRHITGMRWTLKTLQRLGLAHEKGLREEFVLGHRNRLAVDAAVAETRDVVTVWGAGHMPGMHDLLVARGYRLTDRQWVTAIRGEGRHVAGVTS